MLVCYVSVSVYYDLLDITDAVWYMTSMLLLELLCHTIIIILSDTASPLCVGHGRGLLVQDQLATIRTSIPHNGHHFFLILPHYDQLVMVKAY